MKQRLPYFFTALTFFLLLGTKSFAQRRLPGDQGASSTTTRTVQTTDSRGRPLPPGANKQDSLKHRDNTDDSITISFRYFDSTRIYHFDSTINDFTTRYPLPAHYVTMGNFGSAAHSLLFNPILKPGFDAGFHAFDIYRLRIEDARFFQTTRPFTELAYMVGGRGEQTINVLHTQNIRPNFNMAVQYRLINSPGEYQNQNTNHSSFRITGNFQSRNKRYTAYGIFISNKLQASENGGIQRDTLLNDYRYTNRFIIPTRLSGSQTLARNPFNSKVTTGNSYKESIFLYRQQYDFGQSDSLIVNDSTVVRLFYPRFRLQHTITLSKEQYEFHDYFTIDTITRNASYRKYFGFSPINDSLLYRDQWSNVLNDFSIISFPEKNNLNQFIKAGIAIENLKGTFSSYKGNDHNIFLNGEYRNRTRNQKWDAEAAGKFYLNGFNSGDYSAQLNLKRLLSPRLGFLELGFQNVNRSPSFIFTNKGSYPIYGGNGFNKENLTRISGAINNNAKGYALAGDYYIVSNYTYFNGFFTTAQEGTLFNVLHLMGKLRFKPYNHGNFFNHVHWYAELHLQKTAGNPPLHLPLIFTSNRLVFEGNFYRNLDLATGFEVRYSTPYKADNYSPFTGQFFYQDSYTIHNRPEVNFFFDFRIKRFTAYLRFENLNTLSKNTGTWGFNENNYSAQYYPQPGLWIRLGIFWSFIN